MIKTDSHVDSLGTRDFVFSCHNRSFAATWSPLLPKPTETLIDSELVEFLDIPIKKIEARKFSFAGVETRIVGHISQTVQCVVKGKTSGTIHLKASVVRHLTKLLNMDCVAGGQMYKRLANTPDTVSCDLYSESDTNTSELFKKKTSRPCSPNKSTQSSSAKITPKRTFCRSSKSSPTSSMSSSPATPIRSNPHNAWLYQNGSDERYDAEKDKPVDVNWIYDEDYDMWGLPYNSTGPLIKPHPKDTMVSYIMDIEDNMIPFINAIQHDWPEIGQTFPPTLRTASPSINPHPAKPSQTIPLKLTPNNPVHPDKPTNLEPNESIRRFPPNKTEPTPYQPTLDPSLQHPVKNLLHDLVFCGHHQPCPCLPQLSRHQATFLPIHCPLYLPQNHHACGPNCGSHHVHQALPEACHCVPPNISQYLDPPDSSQTPTILNTNPSVQHLSIPDHDIPVMHLPEICDYCDQDDDGCRCEDLYFRLQREQADQG